MSQSELRRDNHYVPRSYLKRWSDDDGRIWTYRILVSHPNVPMWKRHSIKSVAYHRHLYTRVAGGEECDEVERWLDVEFEAAAAGAIEKAVSNGRLTRADWERLVRFLAAQDVRTPARLIESLIRWRENLPADIQETLAAANERLKTDKRDGSPTPQVTHPYSDYYPGRVTIERLPDKQGGHIRVKTVIGRSMWLFALKHLLTKTVNVLLQHRWTILRSPPGVTWLTSDDPVVRLNYENPRSYRFGGGWASTGTEILLPLGPNHLIYTRVGERPPEKGSVVPIEKARLLQRFTIEHAHRYVFGLVPQPSVEQLRPRVVDKSAFVAEAEQWRQWHADQSRAEIDLSAHHTMLMDRSVT